MLVLSRYEQEWIDIPGPNVAICVVEVSQDDNGLMRVRLGFEAPNDVAIHRREVLLAVERGDSNVRKGDACVSRSARGVSTAKRGRMPNAQGPNHVYCKRCGGLVEV